MRRSLAICDASGERPRAGATAVLLAAVEPRATVELPEGTALDEPLAAAVTGSGYVAPAGAAAPLVARIEVRDGVLRVLRPSGIEVGSWPADEPPETVAAVVLGLARQSALLGLRLADPAVTASMVRHQPDLHGVALTNAAICTWYVTAFELRANGSIDLLTTGQPDGEAMAPARTLHLRLSHEPPTGPRRLVCLMTDSRVDLRAWACETPCRFPASRGDGEPWANVLVVDVPPV